MADDIRGDPIEPRECLVRGQLFVPSAPGFQEDRRKYVLRGFPISDTAEAVVVDQPRVPVIQQSKRIGITGARTRPQIGV
jgi:hypothetical protein